MDTSGIEVSNVTIEKAAVAINLASRTLGRYENGFGDITMKVAEKLAELYRVPFESIREAVRETYLLKQNGGN